MKHFILEGRHLAPFDHFVHLEAEHHEFLENGYESGRFLFSGPQVPPHGGFLAARAESREELAALLAEEPFVKGGFMRFSSMTQFDPVQHQPFLKDWFSGAAVRRPKNSSEERNAGQPVGSSRHFLLEGEHLVPFEQRDPALIAAHRAFLEVGYEKGMFLMSGPTIPPEGGFLVARAGSLQELSEVLSDEPYTRAHVMRFSRITEFRPLQHQPFLETWFAGETVRRDEVG